jgi:hypothetical protein
MVCASAVAALAFSGCQALPVASNQSTADSVSVPDVTGWMASSAQNRLKSVGLDGSLAVGDASAPDLRDPTALIVLRESPVAGTIVPLRTHVTLFVSRRPAPTSSAPPPGASASPSSPGTSCPTGAVVFAIVSGWLSNISSDPLAPSYYGYAAGVATNRSTLPVHVGFSPSGEGTDSTGALLIPLAGIWEGGTPIAIPPGGSAAFALRTGVGYPEATAAQVTEFVTEEAGHNAATFVTAVPDGCSQQATIVDAPPVPATPLG